MHVIKISTDQSGEASLKLDQYLLVIWQIIFVYIELSVTPLYISVFINLAGRGRRCSKIITLTSMIKKFDWLTECNVFTTLLNFVHFHYVQNTFTASSKQMHTLFTFKGIHIRQIPCKWFRRSQCFSMEKIKWEKVALQKYLTKSKEKVNESTIKWSYEVLLWTLGKNPQNCSQSFLSYPCFLFLFSLDLLHLLLRHFLYIAMAKKTDN